MSIYSIYTSFVFLFRNRERLVKGIEKKHPCGVCGIKYRLPYQLARHERVSYLSMMPVRLIIYNLYSNESEDNHKNHNIGLTFLFFSR